MRTRRPALSSAGRLERHSSASRTLPVGSRHGCSGHGMIDAVNPPTDPRYLSPVLQPVCNVCGMCAGDDGLIKNCCLKAHLRDTHTSMQLPPLTLARGVVAYCSGILAAADRFGCRSGGRRTQRETSVNALHTAQVRGRWHTKTIASNRTVCLTLSQLRQRAVRSTLQTSAERRCMRSRRKAESK